MEPDSKLPSDGNVPSFFSNNDKNIEESSHKKNEITNSFEPTSKKSHGTSNRTVHWPSLGIGAGIAILGYVLDSVYKTVTSLSFVKYLSLHYYYNNNGVILNGLDYKHFLVLFSIIALSFIIGIYIFNTRDIKS